MYLFFYFYSYLFIYILLNLENIRIRILLHKKLGSFKEKTERKTLDRKIIKYKL